MSAADAVPAISPINDAAVMVCRRVFIARFSRKDVLALGDRKSPIVQICQTSMGLL